jgi:hypothetical protein
MARYRQGPYIVEEGYAMIDQDGEQGEYGGLRVLRWRRRRLRNLQRA